MLRPSKHLIDIAKKVFDGQRKTFWAKFKIGDDTKYIKAVFWQMDQKKLNGHCMDNSSTGLNAYFLDHFYI